MSTIPAPPPMPPAPSPIAEHKTTGQVFSDNFHLPGLSPWLPGGAQAAPTNLAGGNPKQCNLQQTETQTAAGETDSGGEGGNSLTCSSITNDLQEGREDLEEHSLKENSKTESDQEAEAEDLC